MFQDDRRNQPGALSRRRFVQGVAATGAAAAWGPLAAPSMAQALPPGAPNVLSGTDFELKIGSTPINITGRPRIATTVNGSVPAPTLRWREGTTVTLRVTNTLPVTSSIHWHGILLPAEMDGVPGLSFEGIAPGKTFVYRFEVKQSGTYWYHSHSGFQEQTGLYGAIVIDPARPEAIATDSEHVVMLSDWTDEKPERIFSKLKAVSDYYNYQIPTVGDFFRDVSTMGMAKAWARRAEWASMLMNPTDLADLTAATYTYLVNGASPAANHTILAQPGRRMRLRLINSGASSIFDVRIPGLKMSVVSADGQAVTPVLVDELRISTAETYDVIVTMQGDQAYTLFAQAIDRMGYARATLAPRAGMTAPVPQLDPPTWLTMEDMGMGDMSGMAGMQHGATSPAAASMAGMQPTPMTGAMPQMDHGTSANQSSPATLSAAPPAQRSVCHLPGKPADNPRRRVYCLLVRMRRSSFALGTMLAVFLAKAAGRIGRCARRAHATCGAAGGNRRSSVTVRRSRFTLRSVLRAFLAHTGGRVTRGPLSGVGAACSQGEYGSACRGQVECAKKLVHGLPC